MYGGDKNEKDRDCYQSITSEEFGQSCYLERRFATIYNSSHSWSLSADAAIVMQKRTETKTITTKNEQTNKRKQAWTHPSTGDICRRVPQMHVDPFVFRL